MRSPTEANDSLIQGAAAGWGRVAGALTGARRAPVLCSFREIVAGSFERGGGGSGPVAVLPPKVLAEEVKRNGEQANQDEYDDSCESDQ